MTLPTSRALTSDSYKRAQSLVAYSELSDVYTAGQVAADPTGDVHKFIIKLNNEGATAINGSVQGNVYASYSYESESTIGGSIRIQNHRFMGNVKTTGSFLAEGPLYNSTTEGTIGISGVHMGLNTNTSDTVIGGAAIVMMQDNTASEDNMGIYFKDANDAYTAKKAQVEYIDSTDELTVDVTTGTLVLSAASGVDIDNNTSITGTLDTTGLATFDSLTVDTGPITLPNDSLQIDNVEFLHTVMSTGLMTGGVLSLGSGAPDATFSISDGTGLIVDKTTRAVTQITWTGKINITVTNIATQLITFILIDSGANVIQQAARPTESETRDNIFLGVVVHVDNTIVDTVNQEQNFIYNPLDQLDDLFEAIGPINIDNNIFPDPAGDLTFQKQLGYLVFHGVNYFNDPNAPNKLELPAYNSGVTTFQYRLQDGTNITPDTNNIDPTKYDDGTSTLATVPSDQFTIQRVYIFTSGNVKVQPGQHIYATIELAKINYKNELFIVEPSIVANGLFIGYIIVKESCTDLTDPADALFILAEKFPLTNSIGTQDFTFVGEDISNLVSTGLISGGILSIGSPTSTFSITAGTGIHIDAVTRAVTSVSWSAFVNQTVTNIATDPITYICIDKTGSVLQTVVRFDEEDIHDKIILGALIHIGNTVIESIDEEANYILSPASQLIDLYELIGFINIDNTISAKGANLNILKAAGSIGGHGLNYHNNVKAPNKLAIAAWDSSVTDFDYVLQDNTLSSTTGVIDPNNYDNAGTLTTIGGSNKFTVQRVYLLPNGLIFIQPGQNIYNSLAAAEENYLSESFITATSLTNNAICLAFIIVKKGATELNNPLECMIINTGRFGTSGVGNLITGNSTLQTAYDDAASAPHIVINESASLGALQIKGDAAVTNVLEIIDDSDTTNIQFGKNGDITSGALITADSLTVTTGPITLPNDSLEINDVEFLHTVISTGIISGGILSAGGTSTQFTIAAGTGFQVDSNRVITNMSWSEIANTEVTNIGTHDVTYILLDKNNTIIQSETHPTAVEHRDNVLIGILIHDGGTVNDIIQVHDVVLSPSSQIHDLFDALGFINLGNNLTTSGADLTFAKDAGSMVGHGVNYGNDTNSPNVVNFSAWDSSSTFEYILQDGTRISPTTVIDPNNYDNSGTLTLVTNNKFTIQRVYILPSGAVKVQPGQTIYQNLISAEASYLTESFVIEPSLEATAVFIGYIIVKNGTTDLTNTSDCLLINAGKFSLSSGSVSAALLTLQSVYDNTSAQPHITVGTDTNALQIKGHTSVTNILEIIDNADADVLTVLNNGNVGIGTSTPESALHITGVRQTTPTTYGVHIGSGGGTTYGIEIVSNVAGDSLIDFTEPGQNRRGRILYDNNAEEFKFGINNNGYGIVMSDGEVDLTTYDLITTGNVGIGTSTPESALHVKGLRATTPSDYGVHIGYSDSATGNHGMEIVSNVAGDSVIDFTEPGQNKRGRILYDNDTEEFKFSVNNNGYGVILSDGELDLTSYNITTTGTENLVPTTQALNFEYSGTLVNDQFQLIDEWLMMGTKAFTIMGYSFMVGGGTSVTTSTKMRFELNVNSSMKAQYLYMDFNSSNAEIIGSRGLYTDYMSSSSSSQVSITPSYSGRGASGNRLMFRTKTMDSFNTDNTEFRLTLFIKYTEERAEI